MYSTSYIRFQRSVNVYTASFFNPRILKEGGIHIMEDLSMGYSSQKLSAYATEKINTDKPAIETSDWSNLAKVVYKRTYSRRTENNITETWNQTVQRVIDGNIGKYRGTDLLNPDEEERLFYYISNRKAMPAGRGLWFSGTEAQERLGGIGLNNCFFMTADDYENFSISQDLLMLGGGVGMSVEHRFVSKLPKIRKGVNIFNKETNDADFIVPDSREGWVELTRKVLKSYFDTGKSFSYSTVLVRGAGEPIKGFGGTASGKLPLVRFIEKITGILAEREGRSIRPIDALDIICCVGEMVVAGNVRRSALLVQGDAWDKEFLKAKRWDLGNIPTQRAMANLSIVCDDIDDVHPSFWDTYKNGEPFGIINRTNMQNFGRMGEHKKDTALGVNPCSEISLNPHESCNLTEIFLPNLDSAEEFEEAARLMYRWSKRVSCENYHQPKTDEIVKKNRRLGIGITGCLQALNLFEPEALSRGYAAIREEDKIYSKALGVPESIKVTTVKPSGTLSLLGDVTAGIHPAYSKFYIRRVRFASNDPLIPVLKEAGHKVEPVVKFDGSFDHNTLVAEFPCRTPDGTPVADEDWNTWKQLDVLKMVQKYWSDNSVSVTVYYKRDEIPKIKQWLKDNLKEIKSISFLCHSEHGFKQAPYEAITETAYNELVNSVQAIDIDNIGTARDIDVADCEGGVCPVK